MDSDVESVVSFDEDYRSRGSFKTVYRAIDREDGTEVAWNEILTHHLTPEEISSLFAEVNLLSSVDHPNVIRFFDSWLDRDEGKVVFITELMSTGTLKQYVERITQASSKAIIKWSKQLLSALEYFHTQRPKIVHRDLKCDNIFINSNSGVVKIGDLGLSTVLKDNRAASVVGSPEFMAPELFAENYSELVDVYAFGMCVLEMATGEYPFSECENAAQIYRKIMNKVPPEALYRIKDRTLRAMVELCLLPDSVRPSASELLNLPFIRNGVPKKKKKEPVKEGHPKPGGSLEPKQPVVVRTISPERPPEEGVSPPKTVPVTLSERGEDDVRSDAEIAETIALVTLGDYDIRSETIEMNLTMQFPNSKKATEITFPFNLQTDTAENIAIEMSEQFELSDQAVLNVAADIKEAVDGISIPQPPPDVSTDDVDPIAIHSSEQTPPSSQRIETFVTPEPVTPPRSSSPQSESDPVVGSDIEQVSSPEPVSVDEKPPLVVDVLTPPTTPSPKPLPVLDSPGQFSSTKLNPTQRESSTPQEVASSDSHEDEATPERRLANVVKAAESSEENSPVVEQEVEAVSEKSPITTPQKTSPTTSSPHQSPTPNIGGDNSPVESTTSAHSIEIPTTSPLSDHIESVASPGAGDFQEEFMTLFHHGHVQTEGVMIAKTDDGIVVAVPEAQEEEVELGEELKKLLEEQEEAQRELVKQQLADYEALRSKMSITHQKHQSAQISPGGHLMTVSMSTPHLVGRTGGGLKACTSSSGVIPQNSDPSIVNVPHSHDLPPRPDDGIRMDPETHPAGDLDLRGSSLLFHPPAGDKPTDADQPSPQRTPGAPEHDTHPSPVTFGPDPESDLPFTSPEREAIQFDSLLDLAMRKAADDIKTGASKGSKKKAK